MTGWGLNDAEYNFQPICVDSRSFAEKFPLEELNRCCRYSGTLVPAYGLHEESAWICV